MGLNSKCGVQSKRRCESHETCVCIAGFSACGYVYIIFICITPHAENTTIQTQDLWLSHLLLTNIYIYICRESIKKVQACLGLETFTANICPSWGFFKVFLVGLTDSRKTQFDYQIRHIFCTRHTLYVTSKHTHTHIALPPPPPPPALSLSLSLSHTHTHTHTHTQRYLKQTPLTLTLLYVFI